MIQASLAPIHYPFLDALIHKSKARHSLNIGVVYPLSVDALQAAIDCISTRFTPTLSFGPDTAFLKSDRFPGLSFLEPKIQTLDGSDLLVAQKALANRTTVAPFG